MSSNNNNRYRNNGNEMEKITTTIDRIIRMEIDLVTEDITAAETMGIIRETGGDLTTTQIEITGTATPFEIKYSR